MSRLLGNDCRWFLPCLLLVVGGGRAYMNIQNQRISNPISNLREYPTQKNIQPKRRPNPILFLSRGFSRHHLPCLVLPVVGGFLCIFEYFTTEIIFLQNQHKTQNWISLPSKGYLAFSSLPALVVGVGGWWCIYEYPSTESPTPLSTRELGHSLDGQR